MGWDAEGRICAVYSSGSALAGISTMVGYLYDADGTRVAKGSISVWSCDPSSNGFTTTNDYILGLGGEQMTEMGVGGTPLSGGSTTGLVWQHTNVWAGGKLLATYDNVGLHFYFDDPLGTRRAQTDSSGVLEQTCSSLPYGDQLSCVSQPDTGGNISPYIASLTAPTEHHFTGKERDAESGNDYFGARYYSSAMGRFMSPDWSAKEEPVPYAKMDNPQSLNLYSYMQNNPLAGVDADGHEDKKKELEQSVDKTHEILRGDNDCSRGFNKAAGGGSGSADKKFDELNIKLGTSDQFSGGLRTAAAGMNESLTTLWVNPNGAFFNSSINMPSGKPTDLHPAPGTDFIGGFKKTRVMLMLHELAHKLGMIKPDGPSIKNGRDISHENSKQIIEMCKAELNAIHE